MIRQIFYDPSPVGVTYDEIAERGSALSEPLFLRGSRLVIHIQMSDAAVDDFLDLVRQLAEEKRKAGFVKLEGRPNRTSEDVRRGAK
jgi:threonine aldolase